LQRDQGFVIVLSGQRSQLGSTPQLEWSNWRNISFGIPRAPDDFIATTLTKDISGILQQKCRPRSGHSCKTWLGNGRQALCQASCFHEALAQKIAAASAIACPLQKPQGTVTPFKEILTDLNCSDVAVEDDIIAGFKLTGWAPKTGVFHQMSEGLSSLCCRRWHLASTLRTMTISPVDQTTEHVWEETWIEVEKGWLRRSCEKNVMVGTELKEALTLVRNLVEQSKPLEINRSLCRTWITSDGVFEPEIDHPATVGVVLISPWFGDGILR
jgi:hypothetical protein